MKKEDYIKKSYETIEQIDMKNLTNTYQANLVYKSLDLTRETIRYYEKLGLIQPEKNKNGKYRSFTLHDMQRLLEIDFYKKRGFQASEIKHILALPTISHLLPYYQEKQLEIEHKIETYQTFLHKLKTDQQFMKDYKEHLYQFTIQSFPLYKVKATFPALTCFEDYQDQVIQHMNTEQADILSEMMRVVTFDEHGYLTATIAVVELATTIEPDANYLQKGRCMYCIVETTPNDLDTMEKMYTLVVRWAKQHHVDILGVAYIRTRLVVGEVLTSYHECWIPIH